MIFIIDKKEEIVGVLSNTGNPNLVTPFFDDVYLMDLDNGAESYEFSTLADSPESKFLDVGNYVAFNYKGITKLFTIVNVKEVHQGQFIKTVYAETCGLELLNSYLRPTKFTSVNVKQFAEAILSDTPFEVGEVSLNFTEVKDINVSTPTEIYKLIQETIIKEFGAEISFRIKIANNRIVGKYLDLHFKRGRHDLFRFEYGVNMSNVSRTCDATNICTALIGVGNDNLDFKSVDADDKPMGQDFIVNNDAFERFNVRGRHIFGVFEYATDSPHELLKYTREESIKRSVPNLTYELDVELLGADVSLGDTVYVIDNSFVPPLHLEARIKQLEVSLSDSTKDNCVLKNFKEVQSNITDEMKMLSDKLVYVSSKFDGDVEGLKEKIEAIQVGGRNLLLDSVRKVTNTSYPTAIFTLSQQEKYIKGAEYTLTIKGTLGPNKMSWLITNGESLELCEITEKDRKPDGRYIKTFKWVSGDDRMLFIYPKLSSNISESTIEWVKLEFGNVASDHSYAQEDIDQVVDDKINNTETILNQNINNSVSDAKDEILSNVDDKINNTETILNQNIDNSITDVTGEILSNIADKYADKITITELQSNLSSQIIQTNANIDLNFNRVNDYTVKVDGQLQQYKKEVSTNIRFNENGMQLGKLDSPFMASLDNTKLAFLENNNEVAYISNNKMHITQVEISTNLKIGDEEKGFFTWQQGANGNLSLKWSRA